MNTKTHYKYSVHNIRLSQKQLVQKNHLNFLKNTKTIALFRGLVFLRINLGLLISLLPLFRHSEND